MTTQLPIAETARSCGSCSACCYVLGVERVPKPAWQACRHHKRKKGCTLHNTEKRPLECSIYECLWLAGMGERRDRPDRLGLIFDVPDTILRNPIYEGIQTLVCREVRPGALESKRAKALLSQIYQKNAVVLIVKRGKGRKMTGKENLIAELIRRLKASMELSAEGLEKAITSPAEAPPT